MSSSGGLVNTSIDGSFVCADYELRVTHRCLEEDLGRPCSKPFEELSEHEIITAFVNRRADSPIDTRVVAPLTSRQTVYRLAYGHRHRGATWHDSANRVIWLLAYGQHEFEQQGDAFPYFKDLDARGKLFPSQADYRDLFRDRDRRFALAVHADALGLLAAARAEPGREQRGHVGGQLGVGVALVVVETLEELHVAVRTDGLTNENLAILFAAIFADRSFDDIDDAHRMPDRLLAVDELGFRCLLD